MKTLIVTGASKGIGYQIALKALALDYRVINISRTPAKDSRIENYQIDLASDNAEQQVQALINEQITVGEICLVHNAAQLKNDTAINTSTAAFLDIMKVNLLAPHMLNQIVLPHMQPGSSIVYIGSTLSEKAVANTYSYVVSKHAIVGMMRATCQDLNGKDIHTACICPGFTDTEMLRTHLGVPADAVTDLQQSDNGQVANEALTNIAETSTFGRLVNPTEIAACVMFAAGNPVLNGTVLHANLGQIER